MSGRLDLTLAVMAWLTTDLDRRNMALRTSLIGDSC